MNEGWLPCQGRIRSHYFRNGKSLCGRYSIPDSSNLSEVPDFDSFYATPNSCGLCSRCSSIKINGKYVRSKPLPMNEVEQRFEDKKARKRMATMDFRKRFGLDKL